LYPARVPDDIEEDDVEDEVASADATLAHSGHRTKQRSDLHQFAEGDVIDEVTDVKDEGTFRSHLCSDISV
jgi:hypothetical protein